MDIQQIRVSNDGQTMHVNGVTTTIPSGRITTIIGPNGCGKSTLLGAMARSNRIVSGTISLDARDIIDYKQKEFAKKFAIVYQQNDIPTDITVEKLVGYGRLPHSSLFQQKTADDDAAIEWALEATNLLPKRHNDLSALSGGERQRVWIAMALAQKSQMLCLDEPTTYLDIFYQIELLELVKTLNEQYGLTIVMVLHDINQAIRYSDHIVLMKAGQKVAEGPPRDVITESIIYDVYGVHARFFDDAELGYYMMPLSV